MKRRDILRLLGYGAVGAWVSPLGPALADEPSSEPAVRLDVPLTGLGPADLAGFMPAVRPIFQGNPRRECVCRQRLFAIPVPAEESNSLR